MDCVDERTASIEQRFHYTASSMITVSVTPGDRRRRIESVDRDSGHISGWRELYYDDYLTRCATTAILHTRLCHCYDCQIIIIVFAALLLLMATCVMIGSRTGGSPDYVSLQPVGVDSVGDEVVQRFDSTGMFHYCCPRPIEDCLIVSRRPI